MCIAYVHCIECVQSHLAPDPRAIEGLGLSVELIGGGGAGLPAHAEFRVTTSLHETCRLDSPFEPSLSRGYRLGLSAGVVSWGCQLGVVSWGYRLGSLLPRRCPPRPRRDEREPERERERSLPEPDKGSSSRRPSRLSVGPKRRCIGGKQGRCGRLAEAGRGRPKLRGRRSGAVKLRASSGLRACEGVWPSALGGCFRADLDSDGGRLLRERLAGVAPATRRLDR